jgi:hypothetical protein
MKDNVSALYRAGQAHRQSFPGGAAAIDAGAAAA